MPKPKGARNRQLKPVLHIFCEGAKTERNYFNGYLDKFHPTNRRLKVIKVEKTKKNTPVQLVEEALDRKKEKDIPDIDVFWVVYDREATTKYPNKLHQQAFDKASSQSINIALTNVCFEVWILLHFIDVTASYTSCANLLRNSPLKAKLKENSILRYEKADRKVFDVISNDIPCARRRAERMNELTIQASDQDRTRPYLLNPYTDVHKLLDAIDDFVENT